MTASPSQQNDTISNPILAEAVDAFRFVISESKNGTLDSSTGHNIVQAGNGLVRAVEVNALGRIGA